jgi:Spy/CpxP family protein refolding chaperone
MKIKESQLQRQYQTDWPTQLTPEQREQFLLEKIARVSEWYKRVQQHKDHDIECS